LREKNVREKQSDPKSNMGDFASDKISCCKHTIFLKSCE
jgi:hypothetical protein